MGVYAISAKLMPWSRSRGVLSIGSGVVNDMFIVPELYMLAGKPKDVVVWLPALGFAVTKDRVIAYKSKCERPIYDGGSWCLSDNGLGGIVYVEGDSVLRPVSSEIVKDVDVLVGVLELHEDGAAIDVDVRHGTLKEMIRAHTYRMLMFAVGNGRPIILRYSKRGGPVRVEVLRFKLDDSKLRISREVCLDSECGKTKTLVSGLIERSEEEIAPPPKEEHEEKVESEKRRRKLFGIFRRF